MARYLDEAGRVVRETHYSAGPHLNTHHRRLPMSWPSLLATTPYEEMFPNPKSRRVEEQLCAAKLDFLACFGFEEGKGRESECLADLEECEKPQSLEKLKLCARGSKGPLTCHPASETLSLRSRARG